MRGAGAPLGPGGRRVELLAVGDRQEPQVAVEPLGSTSADSSSPSVAPSASAKPLDPADAPSGPRVVRAIARRTTSARCDSVATGRGSPSASATCSKRSSNVPMRPARRTGCRLDEVSLDPLYVSPVRDDEPGIAVEHAQIPLQEQGNLPACAGPTTSERPIRPW